MLKSINTLQIERTMIRMEMKTEILPASDEKSIEKAAALLQNGELVALPTETVYGIAADARNGEAVKKIFVAKGRPQDNPLRSAGPVWTPWASGCPATRWPAPSLKRAAAPLLPPAPIFPASPAPPTRRMCSPIWTAACR